MRALTIDDPGPDSRLEWRSVTTPKPGPREVLVKVHAVGVANTDILARAGFFGITPPIPGIDVAGIVEENGSGSTCAPEGTRVVLNAAVTCDNCAYCASGDHGTCRSRKALGQALDGGYAEYVVVPAANALPIADSLSFEQAAAIPSNFFTAWQMLFSRARVSPGDAILVSGAAGGVGSALVKIAAVSGIRVLGAVGNAEKMAAICGWGATDVLNYGSADMAATCIEATGGQGVDAVLDTVGPAIWDYLLPTLRAGGRLVTCSMTTGKTATVPVVDLLSRQLSIIGTGGFGSKVIADRVVGLFNTGRLTASIHKVLDIDDAEEAHRIFQSRELIGKLVLRHRSG